MRRGELAEMHYISPLDNVASILKLGILSHVGSRGVKHRSLAKQLVQDRRSTVTVPGGRRLHEYVNLYINARNPTLFKMIKDVGHKEICVLRLSTDVLDLGNVVISDQNAAALKYCRYAASPQGLRIVDKDMVFAESWVHSHPADYARHKSVMCAEVLVPDVVNPKFITGAFVSCKESEATLSGLAASLRADVNAHLFFMEAEE